MTRRTALALLALALLPGCFSSVVLQEPVYLWSISTPKTAYHQAASNQLLVWIGPFKGPFPLLPFDIDEPDRSWIACDLDEPGSPAWREPASARRRPAWSS